MMKLLIRAVLPAVLGFFLLEYVSIKSDVTSLKASNKTIFSFLYDLKNEVKSEMREAREDIREIKKMMIDGYERK